MQWGRTSTVRSGEMRPACSARLIMFSAMRSFTLHENTATSIQQRPGRQRRGTMSPTLIPTACTGTSERTAIQVPHRDSQVCGRAAHCTDQAPVDIYAAWEPQSEIILSEPAAGLHALQLARNSGKAPFIDPVQVHLWQNTSCTSVFRLRGWAIKQVPEPPATS